ncbi:MAG: thioredoxin domain-containing protein [Deltaproteobacteria bacterium]|nr:thioredoxin domain-containing protein [Deltaproteobacteria bacterium]
MTRTKAFLNAGLAVILAFGFSGAAMAETPKANKAFEDSMTSYLASDSGQAAVGKAVEEYFKKRQSEARKQQEEQASAAMEEQFKNPVKIDVGSSPVIGPADAKVTIIEFSDFQCPYCKRGYDTMKEIEQAYPKDVRIAFKNLPLPFHPHAKPAAMAALAAGKQGKFWEFHDALFENQADLGDKLYEATAQKLGLNMEKWKKDMASPEVAKQIEDDMAVGAKNGIQGTPGFFVNGVAVKGAYPASHFKMIIDRWLSGKSAVAANAAADKKS